MRRISNWLIDVAEAQRESTGEETFLEHRTALQELSMKWDRYETGAELKEVMTRANFVSYFQDSISRQFFDQYQYQDGAWKAYTYADTTPDFRGVDRGRSTNIATLKPRREKETVKKTGITADLDIEYNVEEFSQSVDFSWQVLVNDDLGEIRKLPGRMLKIAKLFEDSFVSNLYDNAASQAWLAGLGAAYSGTGRLTAANLAIAWSAMQTRVDSRGNPINVGAIHLVIPPILKIQAQQILKDTIVNGGADSNVLNDFIAGVHVDPYITTSGADVPWYLFADPNVVEGCVPVARWEGAPNGPFAFMKMPDISQVSGSVPAAFMLGSYETGNIDWAVESIIGGFSDVTQGGIADENGIYYSDGTTP